MLQRLLVRLWTRFIAYDIAYRLEAVDDRILADMGINRDEIPAFARRAAVPAAGPPATVEVLKSRQSCHGSCGVPV